MPPENLHHHCHPWMGSLVHPLAPRAWALEGDWSTLPPVHVPQSAATRVPGRIRAGKGPEATKGSPLSTVRLCRVLVLASWPASRGSSLSSQFLGAGGPWFWSSLLPLSPSLHPWPFQVAPLSPRLSLSRWLVAPQCPGPLLCLWLPCHSSHWPLAVSQLPLQRAHPLDQAAPTWLEQESRWALSSAKGSRG